MTTSKLTGTFTAKLAMPPPAVGYWKFFDVQYHMTKKPRWLTRKTAKLFFEMEWFDKP